MRLDIVMPAHNEEERIDRTLRAYRDACPRAGVRFLVALDSCTDQAGNPLTTDQRGFARPDAGEDVCDIGAYESQETFAGQPRTPNCHGVSVSALVHEFGSMHAAASALGFHSVDELRAITSFPVLVSIPRIVAGWFRRAPKEETPAVLPVVKTEVKSLSSRQRKFTL